MNYVTQNIFNPEVQALVETFLFMGATKPNDLGSYDGCNKANGTHYQLQEYYSVGLKTPVLHEGYCLPDYCTEKDMGNLTSIWSRFLTQYGVTQVEVKYYYPKKMIDDYKYDGGFVFIVTLLCILGVLILLGILVEYTTFGNKSDWKEQQIEEDLNEQQKIKIKDNQLIEKKEKWAILLLAFSFTRNLRKLLLGGGETDPNLKVLNGIRVLSMCYVMLGHAYSHPLGLVLENQWSLGDIIGKFMWTIVPGGFYAVDVFFFLSGFLATFLMIEKMYPKKGKINFLQLYFHRVYRLLPAILFLMAIAQ